MTVEIAIQNAILKNVDDRTLQISLHFGILPHFIIGVAVKKDFFRKSCNIRDYGSNGSKRFI